MANDTLSAGRLHVGIVGAGVMGRGLSQDLAQAGHTVTLVDINPCALQLARDEVEQNLRLYQLLGRELPTDARTIMNRIRFGTDLAQLGSAEFVVENITEKWEAKQPVYRRLDETCGSSVVFAANTSAISITQIGAATGRPDRVIGTHFMNPVPLTSAVEVIRGYHTSDATLESAIGLVNTLGKEAIVVHDVPGFVSNRVLMLSINEAICLVQENVASVEDIDRIFRSCFGHKMGMLETADLIGLDTILDTLEVLRKAYGGAKYSACPLLRKMVDAGLLGKKSGRGFYSYQPGTPL
jgi:3-hydroxybutyryl-CoA dehydrogenase